jgi:peroxiredoxin
LVAVEGRCGFGFRERGTRSVVWAASGIALASCLSLALVLVSSARAEELTHPTLAIGSTAPAFDLPGVDGRHHTLGEYGSAPVLVVIFSTNHCPTAQAYEARIQRLHDDFKGKGVAVVVISPNDPAAVRLDELSYSDMGDTLEEMKRRAADRGFTFPYLYDGETQSVARAYGPAATPHVFVFDKARKLRFTGRIDNSEDPSKATTHETRDAVDALLAGKAPAVDKTRTFGCSVKWAEKKAWAEEGFRQWAREPVELKRASEADIRALTANPTKKLRLVNVWATWCGPCVIEFPDLVKTNRMYRGRDFEIITISADSTDNSERVLAFLRAQQASTTNLLFDGPNTDSLAEAVDPKWSGALPTTILVAPGGKVIWRSEGAFDPLALRRAIVGWLGRYYHSKPGEAQ